MRIDGLVRVAVVCMGLALLLMLVCLSWPTPRTIALFLGGGLGLGATGVAAFTVRVVRDLRARRMLCGLSAIGKYRPAVFVPARKSGVPRLP